jgi:exopolysaccharide biosynthesis polyprenyl glycosylphosphotransferase
MSFGVRAVEDVERSLVILIPEASSESDTSREIPARSTPHRYRMLGIGLAIVDVLCLTAALLAAHALRFGSLPERRYLYGMALAAGLWLAVFHALGLYAPSNLTRFEEFRRTISAVGIGLVLIILLTFGFEVYLSRSWMAVTLGLALALELVARGIARAFVASLRRKGTLELRTLVVGWPEAATGLMEALDRPASGFRPLGCIDVTSPALADDKRTAARQIESLRGAFRHHAADCVFVASPGVSDRHMAVLMTAARQEGLVLQVFTSLPGILTSRLTVKPIAREGVALALKPARLSATQRFTKRGMDLVLGGVGLIALSPILLVVGIAIRLTSAGPALFRQERVTEGGRRFRMLKFRTMTVESERVVEHRSIDTSAPYFKIKDDPRITRSGQWLRKWSIDELPQLVNVLVGDMSLVGPRPLPSDQVAANRELLGPRLEVRAGVTGWLQINGRSDIDPEGAIAQDHFYIENWSPSLDLYILLRTIIAVFRRKGAY